MGLLADELIRRLDFATRWPIDEDDAMVRAAIEKWIAFRENDRDKLEQFAEWRSSGDERYMVDPLPERVSGAFASLLFGREPTVKVAEGNPQERMDEILRENRWGSRLRTAEETCSSEGQVYWRIVADAVRFDVPVLTWHSRLDVVPHFVNQQLRAVAFINRLVSSDPSDDDDSTVWRHFEVHDDDDVINVLYAGTETTIGERVELTEHPFVEALAEEWHHEHGMLAGRIINIEGIDIDLPKSDYDGIEDHFLELNECFMTGRKNRGLTGLQRGYGPRSATDETGALPEGENFIAVDDTDLAPGMGDYASKFGVLEFKFDAVALMAWANGIATAALARRGITPQFVGQATDAEGFAQSGTALRMRLIPSTNEGDRRRGPWRDETDGILMKMQRIDASPAGEERGFASPGWGDPDEPPAVTLGDPLPVDEVEDAGRISTLRAADAISIEQAVRERNPDWDDTQISEEVKRIKEDRETAGGIMAGNRGQTGDELDGGADLPEQDGDTADFGEGVSVTATAEGFEVAGLPAPGE